MIVSRTFLRNQTQLKILLTLPIKEQRKYSSLPNSTPQGIIRTGVGIPSLGFLFSPRFFFFATLGYYSALGFTFLPPQAIILPQVFHFCQPLLLFHLKFCTPRFSYSALGFSFLPPQAIIPPQVFSFSHPRLLFCPRFFTLTYPRLLFRPRLLFSREEYMTKLM